MKKLFTLLLALTMLLSFAACGGGSTGGSNANAPKELPSTGLLFEDRAEVSLGTPEKTLDPETVYSAIEYEPRMFYGDYRIPGGDSAEEQYAEEMPLMSYPKEDNPDYQITSIPFQLVAGPNTLNHIVHSIKGKDFLRAYFYSGSGNLDYFLCAYTVEGNTLTLNPFETYEYNEKKNSIRYSMSDIFWSYTFEFKGTTLTLSNGTDSLELQTALDAYGKEMFFHIDNYLSSYSAPLDHWEQFRLYWDNDQDSGRFTVWGKDDYYGIGSAKVEDNGLVTMTIPTEDGSKTYQFVYFYCDNDGMILTDGENKYYFCDSYMYSSSLADNLSTEDISKLENMDQEKLEQLVQKQADLLNDLGAAFKDAGLAVTINEATGEITMDSSVLFPVAGYQVSAEGKALLKSFMGVYTSVVFDEKYDGFVSKIMVEGHTDSTGDYDENTVLSENRANAVRDFCLSADCGVDSGYTDKLSDMLTAIGYSCDKLIFDSKGNEDMAASRRVCFRFIINLES